MALPRPRNQLSRISLPLDWQTISANLVKLWVQESTMPGIQELLQSWITQAAPAKQHGAAPWGEGTAGIIGEASRDGV